MMALSLSSVRHNLSKFSADVVGAAAVVAQLDEAGVFKLFAEVAFVCRVLEVRATIQLLHARVAPPRYPQDTAGRHRHGVNNGH